MSISNEIINAVTFYQVLKKDLHTMIVKKSEAPFDYEGKLFTVDNGLYIKYPINEEQQGGEMYHALASVGMRS